MKHALEIKVGAACAVIGTVAGVLVAGRGVPSYPESPTYAFLTEVHAVSPGKDGETFRGTYGLTSLDDDIVNSPVTGDPSFREAVDQWVLYWGSTASAWFPGMLERMERYVGTVDVELQVRDLPESLRYLPVIESGYTTHAVSRAAAVGMWQLMEPTAEELGLEVSNRVDERTDRHKATNAALTFLDDLHDQYGSWFMALAAYNAGPGRVNEIVRWYGRGEEYSDELFWRLRHHFPQETREFVPKLFGAMVVASNPELHGYGPDGTHTADN